MYWSIGVASIGLGAWRGAHEGLDWGTGKIVLFALAIGLASAVGHVLILRQLALVCDTKGWLRFFKWLSRRWRAQRVRAS